MTPAGRKALLLGSGELGKEVAIELQRMGFSMLDAVKLREVIEQERPDHIIPEIEAIATPELVELEKEGFKVTPTARAARLTMNREGIRRLAAEELGVATSARGPGGWTRRRRPRDCGGIR